MATIHDPIAPQVESQSVRPNLRIVGLHIRGLRAIRSLDLPADGLGWNDQVPNLVIVGGINGSGKTTLLEFLAGVCQLMYDPPREYFDKGHGESVGTSVPDCLLAQEAWVDFQIDIPGVLSDVVRFALGEESLFTDPSRSHCFGYRLLRRETGDHAFLWMQGDPVVLKFWYHPRLHQPSRSMIPGAVYIPSEERTFVLPQERFKAAGKSSNLDSFVYRWRPPEKWEDSLEARLYSARWEDLNAKEEGRPQDAHHFNAYSREFERFFGGAKSLKWVQGELTVELKNGTQHDLSRLSSGEKQVITLMGEILHRWRPGSLILIDEPELHLHSSWLTRLWEALEYWQRERGGQVIVATQSNHLFQIAEPRTAVLLGGVRLA